MTNHHFTGVFSITERRYDRRLFSQETNKNKKKKETGVRGMWRRTYAQLKNFSFYLLPVSPLFGKKMKRLGLHFISLYFHNNTTVCVCVICFCLVRVLLSPAFRVEKWSHLILGPVYYPPPTGCMLYTLSILHLLWKYRPIVFLFALLSPNLSVLFQFLFSVSKWVQGLACVRTCNQRRYNTRAIFL